MAMTIGKVADHAGVGVETVRYYEREGLIAQPPRRGSAFRQYPPEAVDRIRFIRAAKELGFSLKEIRDLLDLRLDPGAACGDVQERALSKIRDIDEKLASLQRMRDALRRLAEACDRKDAVGECPILDALEGSRRAAGAGSP